MRTLVLGEALVDAVSGPDGGVDEHVGGSPANVAFGLAALGHEVRLATWIGQDERGARIEEVAAGHGVVLTPGSHGADRTPVARATLDHAGGATYTFDLTWDLPETEDLGAYGHVHTGSIAAVLEPGGAKVRRTLERARPSATVSYDPNARPALMGTPDAVRPVVESVIASADVVKMSDEDIAWLFPGQDLEHVVRRWDGTGPSLVVVTRGGGGILARLPRTGEEVTLAAVEATVVDTVGAGDSFMAGLVSGLIDEGLLGGPEARRRLGVAGLERVRPALDRALRTAAETVSRPGAFAPSRADLT